MRTVLVVDDEENFVRLYEMVLEAEGYEIRSADSGEAAVESIQAEMPDLVVLDIKMAGMDGLETLNEIKRINRDLPVILSTAYSTYKSNFTTWLADAYVVKSPDMTELKHTVKELLELGCVQ